jgi:hypothetical protein
MALTVKSFLKKHLSKLAEYHQAHQAHHEKMAAHHEAAADALGKAHDDDDDHAKAHLAMAKAHRDMAEACAEHAAGCEEQTSLLDELTTKAADTTDLNKLVPDHVRSAIPMPEAYGSAVGLTAVPRHGQPAINEGKPEVPLEFEHLVKVE